VWEGLWELRRWLLLLVGGVCRTLYSVPRRKSLTSEQMVWKGIGLLYLSRLPDQLWAILRWGTLHATADVHGIGGLLTIMCAQNRKPSGVDTSSVPRPKLGNVLIAGAGIYDCVNAGEIAITFDDGPYLYTNDLLDKFKVCDGGRSATTDLRADDRM